MDKREKEIKSLKKKVRRKKKVKFIKFIFVILLLVSSYLVLDYYNIPSMLLDKVIPDGSGDLNKNKEREELEKNRLEEEKLEEQREEKYNECLTSVFSEEEVTEEITKKKEEITKLIENNGYRVSVMYEDINSSFSYSYNAEKVFYGCSLIKLVDALYLIDKASQGEIDLDKETIKYTSNFKAFYSSGMDKHKIGDEVSLKDLITYAVSVSDNTAHFMLIDYIGFNNLKEYGKSLGAKVILTGGDEFGNQTAKDTNIYLKEAYKVISENKEYGEFLKNIMDNDERNAYNTDDIKVHHKYGSYDIYYHDIGLRLINKPYTISILTTHEKSGYDKIIKKIHSEVIELHELFQENRVNYCKILVYNS